MFARIETKGAHSIVIAIPHEGSNKSLPAVAKMFEQNAVFISSAGWQENTIVKPEMTIYLAQQYTLESKNDKIMFVEHDNPSAVISSEWVPFSPDVFISNAAQIKKLEEQISRLHKEKMALEVRLEQATEAKEVDS